MRLRVSVAARIPLLLRRDKPCSSLSFPSAFSLFLSFFFFSFLFSRSDFSLLPSLAARSPFLSLFIAGITCRTKLFFPLLRSLVRAFFFLSFLTFLFVCPLAISTKLRYRAYQRTSRLRNCYAIIKSSGEAKLHE